jgi:uncharacterized protein (TIRG00374 family)
LVRCHFAGLFANLFLPSIAGGDVVRAGLAIRHKAKKEAVIFGGLLDRFVDISALGAIIVVSALYSPKSLSAQDRTILFSFLLAVLIFILGMSVIVAFPVVKSLPKRLNDLIQRVQAIIKQLLGNPKRALGGFFLALIIQSCFVVLNIMMGLACKIDLPLHIWFLAWPLAKLSAMLPISLGGLGVREMAFALLLDRFNIPFSRSVGLGLLWESVLIAGGAIGGFIGLVGKNRIPRADLVLAERSTSKGNVTF